MGLNGDTKFTRAAKRTFLRRTKATSPPDTTEADAGTTDNEKLKRGSSRFKSRESARNETSVTRRPYLVDRRGERPATRGFVRRRLGANVTTTTVAPVSWTATVTRRPFRIASRRRPTVSTTTPTPTTTSAAPTTTAPTTSQATTRSTTTLESDSEEYLQDIGDIDAIEDPSLEPRVATKSPKTQRRPLLNLRDDVDQNPSATNEEESKRQSKKYSSSFKQNQLGDILKDKYATTAGTTLEDLNAETAIAIATHQLITAPLPSITDYDEGTQPTRPKTTYTETTAYTNTPYGYTATYKTNPTTPDFTQSTTGDYLYNTRISTAFDEPKTTDFTTDSRPLTYETRNYDVPKTTEGVTTDSKSTQDVDGKLTAIVTTDAFSTTLGRQTGYTNVPTQYEPRISTTFEVPKQTETLRYSTPEYRVSTNQYEPTTRDYTNRETTYYTTEPPFGQSPRGFTAPNVITAGYTGVQRGNARFQNDQKSVTTEDYGYSTSGYRSSSQGPAYFTREYLLKSPTTKTFDDEYQYVSSTTPQSATQPRKVFRKKIQRKISTTLRPTTEAVTTLKQRTRTTTTVKPVAKVEPNRTYRPVVNYDYYDDSAEKMALKYAEGTKVILHGKGSVECLDVGNFPHPSSCKKFISCARMEFGSLLGWEYVCPQGLSFDPVGGICNWAAGLGCEENDV